MSIINTGKIALACVVVIALTMRITTPKAEANKAAATLSVARTAFGSHDYLVLQRDSTVVGFCHDPECLARETRTNTISL